MRNDDKPDKELRCFINNQLGNITMTREKKQLLKAVMLEEMRLSNQGLLQRGIVSFKRFLDTTYEISLAPVLAFTGAVVIGFTFVGTAHFPGDHGVNNPPETEYLQQIVTQPDGGAHVIYTPVQKGGS